MRTNKIPSKPKSRRRHMKYRTNNLFFIGLYMILLLIFATQAYSVFMDYFGSMNRYRWVGQDVDYLMESGLNRAGI